MVQLSGFDITEIVSGCANGIDKCGEDYAQEHGIPIKQFPAKWDDLTASDAVIKTNKFGKKYDALAGLRRNKQMAEYSDALIAIIKNGSPGTTNMIEIAKELGLKIYIWEV